MNRHKRSHYKTKSRLFLFGDQVKISGNQLENKSIVPVAVPVALLRHSQVVGGQEVQLMEENELIDSESAMIPVSKNSSCFSQSQVPGHSSHQHIVIGSFEINAKQEENGSAAVKDQTSHFALNAKLLIPRTILNHQEQTRVANGSNSTHP